MANKPGKYAHITPNLPKFVDVERNELVESVKQEILTAPPSEYPQALVGENLDEARTCIESALALLKQAVGGKRRAADFAVAYSNVRLMKEELKAWLASTQMLVDAYEVLMVAQMEAEAVGGIKLTTGDAIASYQEPYIQVQDKELYRRWCIEQGLERDMHLWPSKTESLVKERLLAGEPEPPGTVAYSKTQVRFTPGA